MVWLRLCFFAELFFCRMIILFACLAGLCFGWRGWGSVFLPRKGTRKHKNLNEWVRAAGRFLCIFVPLCGYDSAGRWVVLCGSPCLQRLRVVNQLPCLGCGFVGMILPKPHLVGSRRQKNDSAFNDSAKNASGWEH
jgi:hypothetical protein